MKLRWAYRARQDLKAIGRFIARDNPHAARKFVARLLARARKATGFPLAGRMVPELQRKDVREVILGNYRIVYRVNPDSLDVLTVFEGHRLFPEELINDDL